MTYDEYFLEELASLRELGKDFSQSHPRLAPFLAQEAQDPDVERLLEGFAFLSARLRQKLDDEFPELSHSLLRVLWPHALRPIPSLSTLEFKPLSVVSEVQEIPRGTGVASEPVQGTPCRFQTCTPVDLYPLKYQGLEVVRETKATYFRMKLEAMGQSRWSAMNLGPLRLHTHGDVKLAYSLYWTLLTQVSKVRIYVNDGLGNKRMVASLSGSCLTAEGFADDQSLLPNTAEFFPGFRYLFEYFNYPEKFLYVKLSGLEAVTAAAQADSQLDKFRHLEIDFQMDAEIPRTLNPKKENIRLFCTPIVNLFAWDARPIEVDHRHHEYRLVPEGNPRDHFDIFSIDQISGWGHNTRNTRTYQSFDSFAFHRQGASERTALYWQKLKPSVLSRYGYDSYLSFLSLAGERAWPERETISAQVTCTNRILPADLELGSIHREQSSTPEFVEFSNISSVTPCLFPIQEQTPLWQVLAYLSQNYRALADLAALRNLMAVLDVRGHYDRQHSQASKLKRDALVDVSVKPSDRLLGGTLWRGTRIRILVQEDHFLGEGDLFLFGSILNELFASTVPINSFHELELVGTVRGLFHRWEPKLGRQALI